MSSKKKSHWKHAILAQGSSLSLSALSMVCEPCRFGSGCRRPLCLYTHGIHERGRAEKWSYIWSALSALEAEQEESEGGVAIMSDIFRART